MPHACGKIRLRKFSLLITTPLPAGTLHIPSQKTDKHIESEEMTIIRRTTPIRLIVHHPKTTEGCEELGRRVSGIHTAAVTQQLKMLNCPESQTLELLDAIIADARKRSKEQA